MGSEWVTLEANGGGSMTAYLATPGGDGARAGVIVCHELFGVTDDIAGVADLLAGAGFVALAPELYHRDQPARTRLPRDDAGRAEGFAQLGRLTRDGVVEDLDLARTWLLDRPDTTDAVGALGLSMGGHLAFLGATQLPLAATAVLYGGWLLGTDIPPGRPEPTISLSRGISGAVLYVVGSEDHLVPAADREAIDAALTDAGVPHEVVVEDGVGHAYVWPGTPAYDAAATEDTWERVLAFLTENLGPSGGR